LRLGVFAVENLPRRCESREEISRKGAKVAKNFLKTLRLGVFAVEIYREGAEDAKISI